MPVMQKRHAALDALDLKILARYQRDTRVPAQAIDVEPDER
jgi:hypothetical protein